MLTKILSRGDDWNVAFVLVLAGLPPTTGTRMYNSRFFRSFLCPRRGCSQMKGHFSHQTRVWDKTNLCFRSSPLSCNVGWAGTPEVGFNERVELNLASAVATVGASPDKFPKVYNRVNLENFGTKSLQYNLWILKIFCNIPSVEVSRRLLCNPL